MSRTRGSSLRGKLGVLLGSAVTLAMLAPGGASALQNGEPCSPFFTEVMFPEAQFLVVVSSLKSVTLKSVSNQGLADVWTYVSADNLCEATSTEADPFASYTWDFVDGSSTVSSAETTSHTYARAGTYNVKLTVTERDCEAGPHAHCFTGSATVPLTIPDLPPVASFTAPASTLTGRAATFDASASADPDGTIASYRWDFGDGQVRETASPTIAHSFTLSGPKTVTLTVTDDSGSVAQASHEVSVSHLPPVASFTAPASVSTGQPARFDGSSSSDPDGTITSYRWDFGDGTTQITAGPRTSHIYRRSGTWAVTLTVVDDSASTNLARHAVTVADRAPIAAFTAPASVDAGQTARFDASTSSDPDGTITSYRWDFGHGATDITADPRTSHTYSKGGAKTATLTVTDDNDNTAQTAHAVMVVGSRCVVPRLVGNKLGRGRKLLRGGNCHLGAVRHKHAGPRRKGRVTGQSVKPGAIRPPGAGVAVTVGN
jgi:large repetitive protein